MEEAGWMDGSNKHRTFTQEAGVCMPSYRPVIEEISRHRLDFLQAKNRA